MYRRFLYVLFAEMLAACMVVSFVTLARAFHFEFALAAAVIVFFAAVVNSVNATTSGRGGRGGRRLLLQTAALAVIPLVPVQIDQWIHQPCDQEAGFLFYFLYVVPAALCGAGAALLARRLTGKAAARVLIIAAVIAVPTVYILWTLYFDAPVRFHHWIFGMWPGSLYDERVTATPALYWGRLEGFLLGAALLTAGIDRYKKLAIIPAIAFALLVVMEPSTGVRVPLSKLRETFGPAVELPSAHLYFDPAVPDEVKEQVRATADETLAAILTKLGLEKTPPVELFVFRDVAGRYVSTGARNTTYTKPWQGAAYLEPESLASQRGKSLLRHELTHLVTAQWGPVLGLPWNVSLLEGTAVAVSPPPGDQRLKALSQVVLEKKPDLDLEKFLRRFGFWAQSPATAYPLAGAFGEFVLDTHGPGVLKNLWQLGPFDEPAGSSWEKLAGEFRDYLQTTRPSESEKTLGAKLARQKSIFEKRCPHDVRVDVEN